MVRLIEVDPTLAQKLQVGQSLVLKGQPDDNVVLCTDDKTYEIKEAETSNSLLILDRLQFPKDISSEDSERNLTKRFVIF